MALHCHPGIEATFVLLGAGDMAGVSLVGGRGNVVSVIAGTLLIGVLLNAMTIMNLDIQTQDVIKGAVLLLAITLDSYIHPRDEETAKQGD